MYAPVLVTPPVALTIPLAEMKLHLRVDVTDDDALITSLIHAARDHLDGWTGILGRALDAQTWRQDFDGFSSALCLPLHPLVSVTSVTYVDADGDTQTVDASVYQPIRTTMGNFAVPRDGQAWPSAAGLVSVTYVAGTGVPDAVRAAMKLLVGNWYENRESVTAGAMPELPMAVNALLAPYRRVCI